MANKNDSDMSDIDEFMIIWGCNNLGLQCSYGLGAVVPLISHGGPWKKQNFSCQATGQLFHQVCTTVGTVFTGVTTISS